MNFSLKLQSVAHHEVLDHPGNCLRFIYCANSGKLQFSNNFSDVLEALSRLIKIMQFIRLLWLCQFKANPCALTHTPRAFDGHLNFFFSEGDNGLPLGNWRIQNSCGGTMRKVHSHPWDSVKLYFIAILLCTHKR